VRFVVIVLSSLCLATVAEAQVRRPSLTVPRFVQPAPTAGIAPSRDVPSLALPTCEDGPVPSVLLGAALGAGTGLIISLIAATRTGAESGFTKKTNVTPYVAVGAILGAVVANSSWQRRCG